MSSSSVMHGSSSANTTIAIVGASGGVGSAVVRQALAAGHRVRALARSRSKVAAAIGEDTIGRFEAFVEGTVSDPSALEQLLSKSEGGEEPTVVISCLGTPARAPPCVCDGTQSLLKAMSARGPGAPARLIMISSIGVGDSYPQGAKMAPFFARCIIPLFLKKVFADLDRAEEALWREGEREGGVRSVAVRPPALTNQPGKGPSAIMLAPASNLKPAKQAKISREDVASSMLQLVEPILFDKWAGKGVSVVVP